MGKFLKKIGEVVEERKQMSKLKALGMSQKVLEGIYQSYFYSMQGFVDGSPSRWQVWGLNNLVYEGLTGVQDKARVRGIVFNWRKSKLVLDDDKDWIVNELRPFFEASLKLHTKKVFGELMAGVDLAKLDKDISAKYKATKGRYK